jgi:N-methylhydantoinase A
MRAAIDIGGTFTDVLLFDDNTGGLWSEKLPSTPSNPTGALLSGLFNVLLNAKRDFSEVDLIIHGTTIMANALLAGETARIGLLVTKGFRDLLEIGRQQRPDLYDLMVDRSAPLVPRNRVLEVEERVSADGTVVVPLNEEDAQRQIYLLKEMGIDSLAIVLLFSFKFSDHEEKLGDIARRVIPSKFVFLSSQISPEFREFERASTTAVAAAVAPIVNTYLETLQANLQAEGGGQIKSLLIMHSGGGTLRVKDAMRQPHSLVESGPAAGMIAAARISRYKELDRCIAFDMGGTTAKAGLVLDGQPQHTTDYEIGGEIHHSSTRHGGGYPIRFPMIDLVECGAGAGSIAWIDPGGHLKVGPQSAGADPGPSCYGRGGKLPTVTDAYLVLGYLSPHSFLGGQMELHMEDAVQAIEKYVAEPLILTLEKAALGIVSIINANMLRILRVVSVARGHDPRKFTLITYGGAGPLHACALADELSINQIIVPRFPGMFSALGLLNADMTMDFVKTVMVALSQENLNQLNTILAELQKEAESWFQGIGIQPKEHSLKYSADMRYVHQNYEINLPIPGFPLTIDEILTVKNQFHQAHGMAYGHSSTGEIIQVVNLRLLAIKHLSKPPFLDLMTVAKPVNSALIETRNVYFPEGRKPCMIYQRSMLETGHTIIGPAIVREKESTTVVSDGWFMEVDKIGNLVINRMLES